MARLHLPVMYWLYWTGTFVFAALAVEAWRVVARLLPWGMLSGSGGVGFVTGGTGDVLLLLVVPLAANLLIARHARQDPLASVLRRLQLATWLAAIAASILLVGAPTVGGLPMLALVALLIPTQLTLLTATFAVLAARRTRRALHQHASD